MGTMASQITSLAIAYSTVYSGADQRKHQSSASLALGRGIHRGPVNSPHKRPTSNAENVSIWWRHHCFVLLRYHQLLRIDERIDFKILTRTSSLTQGQSYECTNISWESLRDMGLSKLKKKGKENDRKCNLFFKLLSRILNDPKCIRKRQNIHHLLFPDTVALCESCTKINKAWPKSSVLEVVRISHKK